MPELLNLQNENDLIERVLYAIELLISKRSNYIPVLDRYKIFKAIRQIVKNEYADVLVKVCSILTLEGFICTQIIRTTLSWTHCAFLKLMFNLFAKQTHFNLASLQFIVFTVDNRCYDFEAFEPINPNLYNLF